MAVDLSLYHNREQSYIKHQFLTKYLQAAAFKILQSRSPVFNFVDAFAGPWQVPEDPDYAGSSFDQAIKTLEAVRGYLEKNGKSGLRIRFCFCELRPSAVAKLREYAKRQSNFDISVFEGAFEDNLEAISAALPDGFTFTFIDPKGWNIRNKEVFEFLKQQKGEFLLNFMADHINRHSGYEKVSESFGRFLANPSWEAEFTALLEGWSNERRVLHLLKQNMRSTGVAKFLPDFSILLPREDRLKMRLILGTHSPEGLFLFRDVQEKVELEEMELRGKVRKPESPQADLFSDKDNAEIQQTNDGVGCKKFQQLAETQIVELLGAKVYANFHEISTAVMDSVPIRITQLKLLLREMKDRQVITYSLEKPKRVPQPLTKIALYNIQAQPE